MVTVSSALNLINGDTAQSAPSGTLEVLFYIRSGQLYMKDVGGTEILLTGASSATQMIAGAGLTGGGTLAANRTFDVVAADGTIIVNADSIQLGAVGASNLTLASTSTRGALNGAETNGVANPRWHQFNPMDYGAVDPTGVSSSNAAFAAAVAALIAAPRGGVLVVPVGVFIVNTGTIDFSSTSNPVEIRGMGRASSIIVPNGTGDVIKLSSTADGFSVRDLGIFTSGATQTAGNAINTNGCDDVLIDNCLFNNQFVDIFVNGTSIKVSIQRTVHTHSQSIGSSVGILVTNGAAGDTYIGPDVVMSDTAGTRRRASIEVTQSGHFEINQCNLTGSAQGLLVDPGAGLIVADGFINETLFDSNSVNGVTLNAATATSTIKSLVFVNSWFSGTVAGTGGAGFLTTGTAGGVLDSVELVACRALNNQTHGYQHGFGTGFRWLGGRIGGNSSASSNASDGVNVAAAVSNFSIIGVKSGGTDGAQTGGQQRWGINVLAGASNNYTITDNDVLGNLTGGISDNGTGTSRAVSNNVGGLILGRLAAITASTAALTAADTLIVSAPIPANALQVGSVFRVKWSGTYAATISNACTFRVRVGTAGTIADALITSIVSAAGGTTTVGFMGELLVTCRAHNSATAALAGSGFGIGPPAAGVIGQSAATTVNVNSTVANFISLTAGPAATTSNLTFFEAEIECVG